MKSLTNNHDHKFVSRTKEQQNFLEQENLHYGQMIENAIRRHPMGISEISRQLNISRRTLYNWFEMKNLSLDIIYKIGYVIDYDFLKEFTQNESIELNQLKNQDIMDSPSTLNIKAKNQLDYWMVKYIELLEKFNDRLKYLASHNDHPGNDTNNK